MNLPKDLKDKIWKMGTEIDDFERGNGDIIYRIEKIYNSRNITDKNFIKIGQLYKIFRDSSFSWVWKTGLSPESMNYPGFGQIVIVTGLSDTTCPYHGDKPLKRLLYVVNKEIKRFCFCATCNDFRVYALPI